MNDPNATSHIPLKVFISYSRESPENDAWVADFANKLRNRGVDANIDQFVTGAYPDEGWDTWMFRQIRGADYVLCICTETYKRRAEGDEDPGIGLGVGWEGSIIRKRIYDQEEAGKKKFNAVLPPGSNKGNIPYFLPIHAFQMPADEDDLFLLFGNLPRIQPVPIHPNLYVPPAVTNRSEALQPQRSDIGRSRELKQLTDFWNNPDKCIFTFYGLAQMGKSFTIGKWAEANLAPNQTLRVTLTEDLLPQAIACDIIFGEKEMPETHRLAQTITERFQQKTLVWFENMELALELKPGQESHAIREPALSVLLKMLTANSNIKVILECRYVIDLQEMDARSIGLKETQLHKIAPDYFRDQYHQFTPDEYNLIYEKTGGNTWLMLNIPRTFKKFFFSKEAFLADIGASTLFETYREAYLKLLLDALDEIEAALICRLVFTYKPRPVAEFMSMQPDPGILQQAFQSLYDKLLILPDAENQCFSINGYVREACRLHFKGKPAMQMALAEQQAKIGKKFRREEKLKDQLDKFSFLIKETPDFIGFRMEIAVIYLEMGDKTKSWNTLLDALNIVQKEEDKTIVYNTILHVADYTDSLKWLEEMQQKGLTPNNVSYSTLINKSPDYNTALEWFEEMQQKGLTPDSITYSTLIKKSPNYDTANEWFEAMQEKGLTPDEFSYNTLINKCPNYPTALRWFEAMQEKGLTPDEVSYNILINKSPDYLTIRQWFDEMNKRNLIPSEISYNILVNKSPDYDTARHWFKEMKQKGLTPDVFLYNTLVNKSPNYSTANFWFEEMQQNGLTPDKFSYSTLINKSPDTATAKQWLKEMEQAGLALDEVLFNTLINKSPNYAVAHGWFEEMQQSGVIPNDIAYNTLINKSPDYNTASHWFKEMQQRGVIPNDIAYNTLINKSPNYTIANQVLEEMKSKEINLSLVTFNMLLKKCPSLTMALPLLEEMQTKNIQPQVVYPKAFTLVALQQLLKKDADSHRLLAVWIQQHPPPNEAWKQLFEALLEI